MNFLVVQEVPAVVEVTNSLLVDLSLGVVVFVFMLGGSLHPGVVEV